MNLSSADMLYDSIFKAIIDVINITQYQNISSDKKTEVLRKLT